MSFDALCRELTFRNIEFRRDELLSSHTSFKIGGPAAIMAFPKSVEEAAFLMECCGDEAVVLGRGTNVLAADSGTGRPVIKLCDGLGKIQLVGENEVLAESGVPLAKLAAFAQKNGLTGLEFAHGIPGSLGGAVYMNAGAYGSEMKDVVEESIYFENGSTHTVKEHDFSYRHSIFSDRKTMILSSLLRLEKGEPEEIAVRMKELGEKRRSSQPLKLPSAGSTFKRPETGYAAAMIDGAGLKGRSVGGAKVSEKHAGFIVNTGNATCDDVLRLMEIVQKEVFSAFGVMLEPEVKLIK